MAIYQRGTIYWADVTINGHRTRRSLETDSIQEARRRERDLIRSAESKPAGKSLHDALNLWLNEHDRGRSDISILTRLESLPNPLASQITDDWVRENLGALKPANFNRHVAVLHAALVLALGNAAPRLSKRRAPAGRTRFLSRQEWATLYGKLPAHLKPLCSFALATGLRAENVLRLPWAHVDMDRSLAWVEAGDAKSGKTIAVPLSAEAVQILRGEAGKHPVYVFTWPGPESTATPPVRQHFPYRSTPKTAWLAAVEAAKLSGVTFHTLRHTWASWHVMAGTPLAVLQQLGGWASIAMVQRYAHLAPGHVAEFASRVTVCVVPEPNSPTNSSAS